MIFSILNRMVLFRRRSFSEQVMSGRAPMGTWVIPWVRALLSQGYRVRAGVRDIDNTAPFAGLDCELVYAELLDGRRRFSSIGPKARKPRLSSPTCGGHVACWRPLHVRASSVSSMSVPSPRLVMTAVLWMKRIGMTRPKMPTTNPRFSPSKWPGGPPTTWGSGWCRYCPRRWWGQTRPN